MTKNEMAFAVADFDAMQHRRDNLDSAAQDLQAAYEAADKAGRLYLFETVLLFFKSNLESNRDRLPPCALTPLPCHQGFAARP